MDHKEVKLTHAQVSKATGANEGLRVLARMIARCLMEEKSGVNGQHPHSTLPSGGDDNKYGFQSPGRAGGKQATPPFSCRKLDIPSALTKERGDDG